MSDVTINFDELEHGFGDFLENSTRDFLGIRSIGHRFVKTNAAAKVPNLTTVDISHSDIILRLIRKWLKTPALRLTGYLSGL